jgi:diacylglycerol kinase family enzyme
MDHGAARAAGVKSPCIAVLVNARARSGAAQAAAVETELARAGVDAVIARVTDGAELPARAEALARDGANLLVAAGGDGTVGAVAGVAVRRQLPLGILPLGTFNHFARDMGIPVELADAAAVLAAGHPARVDVGEVNGRIFINNCSLGAYPRLVRLRDHLRDRGMPKAPAAARAALAVLRRHPFLAVRLQAPADRAVLRTAFVLIANDPYQMTALSPAARPSLTAGRLAVYAQRGSHRRSLLWLALLALLGRADDALDVLETTEVVVESRRRLLHAALDGELTELAPPLRVRTRPGALSVIAPPRG